MDRSATASESKNHLPRILFLSMGGQAGIAALRSAGGSVKPFEKRRKQ